MQYRIYQTGESLSIELIFNNNIPRRFRAETIIAKILMFCKTCIEKYINKEEKYRVVFGVSTLFFTLHLVSQLLEI